MTDPRGYQPEGVKYTYPDDDPYQEGNEVYYNMAEFLNDDEFHQIWEIVGKACDRHNIPTDGDQELSVRLYDVSHIILCDIIDVVSFYLNLHQGIQKASRNPPPCL